MFGLITLVLYGYGSGLPLVNTVFNLLNWLNGTAPNKDEHTNNVNFKHVRYCLYSLYIIHYKALVFITSLGFILIIK